MTYPEFLDALRKTPRDWKLESDYEFIRRKGHRYWQCPISALRNKASGDYRDAAARMGLDIQLAREIAHAADRTGLENEKIAAIRRDLLEACGLP
jgi:hypothetical protein